MSKYLKKSTQTSAKSVDEAIALALNELGADKGDVDIDVIDEGSKGFLGLGAKDASVEVRIKDITVFAAKQFLTQLFAAMDLAVDIDITTDGSSMMINLSGENMGIIIGKRGDTLDSLQYLASLIVNQESDEYIKVTIDTENYRAKRADALVALSNRLADKVSKSGKKFTLEPMNPYERRIIHSNLQDSENVTTFSVGDDPYRKVVIAPKNRPAAPFRKRPNNKPSYNKPSHNNRKDKGHPEQKAEPKKAAPSEPLDPSIPTTYKAGFAVNKRPDTKDFKSFDEYLEAHKDL